MTETMCACNLIKLFTY